MLDVYTGSSSSRETHPCLGGKCVSVTRVLVLVGGLALAVCLFVASRIFLLNGEQYDSWSSASALLAAVVALAAVGFALLPPRVLDRLWWPTAFHALFGAAVTATSLVVMRFKYADPYEGGLFWPSLLAWAAFAGAILVVGSGLGAARRR
jgi:hypothetical protein